MEQTRKKFIKNLFIGATSVPILIEACKKSDVISSGSSSTGSDSSSGSGTQKRIHFIIKLAFLLDCI